MRKIVRLLVALAVIGGWAFADDIRNRPPRGYWIPGFLEGDYAGESALNLLPDVIEATLEYLTGDRTVEDLTGDRAIENLTPVRTLEKL